ncbi:hypothetical protein CPC08DRAFT_726854 [Agrocybe pediades]|nr:hypothetical protein CPC08DRAFT_726854 [Agrocybe pediades]
MDIERFPQSKAMRMSMSVGQKLHEIIVIGVQRWFLSAENNTSQLHDLLADRPQALREKDDNWQGCWKKTPSEENSAQHVSLKEYPQRLSACLEEEQKVKWVTMAEYAAAKLALSQQMSRSPSFILPAFLVYAREKLSYHACLSDEASSSSLVPVAIFAQGRCSTASQIFELANPAALPPTETSKHAELLDTFQWMQHRGGPSRESVRRGSQSTMTTTIEGRFVGRVLEADGTNAGAMALDIHPLGITLAQVGNGTGSYIRPLVYLPASTSQFRAGNTRKYGPGADDGLR